eukprot:6464472-Amphidinium_carterae.1
MLKNGKDSSRPRYKMLWMQPVSRLRFLPGLAWGSEAQAYSAESLAIRTLAPSCNLADSREQRALLQQVDASHKTVHKARRRPMHVWRVSRSSRASLWDNVVVARQLQKAHEPLPGGATSLKLPYRPLYTALQRERELVS